MEALANITHKLVQEKEYYTVAEGRCLLDCTPFIISIREEEFKVIIVTGTQTSWKGILVELLETLVVNHLREVLLMTEFVGVQKNDEVERTKTLKAEGERIARALKIPKLTEYNDMFY